MLDIAMAFDLHPTLLECNHVSRQELEYTLHVCPGDSVQFNTGVMLWKNQPIVKVLFENWFQEWFKFKKHDQLALIRALQTTRTPVVELPNIYNFPIVRFTPNVQREHDIRLLHCWGGLVESNRFSKIAMTLMPDSTATALNILSRKFSNRALIANKSSYTMTVTISLIMTVYNRSRYIARAIESVLASSRQDWELIVWDDGSTDGSVEIAQHYARKDARVRTIAAAHVGRVPDDRFCSCCRYR